MILLYRSRRKQPDAGFTLVEILVVLVIIGITVGMVRFNAMPGDADVLRAEATRFSLLVEQAASEARSLGRSYACKITSTGYTFEIKRDDGQWDEIEDSAFRPRQWPEGMIVTGLDIDGQPAAKNQRILLSSSGYNSAFSMRLRLNTQNLEVTGTMMGRVDVS